MICKILLNREFAEQIGKKSNYYKWNFDKHCIIEYFEGFNCLYFIREKYGGIVTVDKILEKFIKY